MIFAFLLILIAGFCEGLMDSLQFHYKSFFKNDLFWNPEISWRNKYKDGDPLKGPKFLFSTTFLVSLTDGWHFMKLCRNMLIFISLPLIGYLSSSILFFIVYGIIARTLYGVGFYLSYNKIFK
jgi:hypothetical protein